MVELPDSTWVMSCVIMTILQMMAPKNIWAAYLLVWVSGWNSSELPTEYNLRKTWPWSVVALLCLSFPLSLWWGTALKIVSMTKLYHHAFEVLTVKKPNALKLCVCSKRCICPKGWVCHLFSVICSVLIKEQQRQSSESESQGGIFNQHHHHPPNLLLIGSSFVNQILNIIHITVSGDILEGFWFQVCSVVFWVGIEQGEEGA